MVGAVYAIMLADWLPVLLALAASHIVQHAAQLVLCAGRGEIDTARLVTGYLNAAIISAALGGCIWGIVSAVGGELDPWVGLVSSVALVVLGILGWLYRRALPPIEILGRYWRR